MSTFQSITLLLIGISTLTTLTACRSDNDDAAAAAETTTDSQDSQDSTETPQPDDLELLPTVVVAERSVVTNERIFNAEAPVPSQCYTATEGQFNPCYTCHQIYDRSEGSEERLNLMDDGYLQGSYDFSDVGETNHWSNLFVDRTDWLAAVSDDNILDYINQDNYSALPQQLEDDNWEGFIPDLQNYQQAALAFDDKGLALDGSYWVAFNYKPFPGTFWPTNGSTDDVVIRLPSAFREKSGQFNADIYYVNLTLVELNLKNLDQATLWEIDEEALGVDIDQNGVMGVTSTVVKGSHYVGDAENIDIMFKQFPSETELMHSVRYVGVTDNDDIVVPARMKELRYMRKVNTYTADQLDSKYWNERKEKFLGLLPSFIYRGDEGFDNSMGWFVQGFIEDYDGSLRPQSYEETMFCMGCHTNIGTTIDSTFSMARKVTGGEGWGYINLIGMSDAPSIGEPGVNETLAYLKRAGGGSEFRENPEMVSKWFKEDGSVDEDKVLAADMYTLITPSRERALALNKAYSHIVRHQSFIEGRDATWDVVNNVVKEVTPQTEPLETQYRFYGWDMRLDWSDQ